MRRTLSCTRAPYDDLNCANVTLMLNINLFCGRLRVAVARYRMICLVLVNSHLFPLPCGAGSAVPREGFDLSVIILASLLVFPMLGCRHSLLRLLAIFHVFVKWNAHFQTFLLVNTCQSGDKIT